MTYATYQKPSVAGITMASGQGTQQQIPDGQLSYLADVQPYAKAIGAQIVNALDDPATGLTFGGIKPTDAAQPWMVTWDGIAFFPAGVAINQQVAATFNLIGVPTTQYPGGWQRQSSGVWLFVPQPLAPVVVPPAVSSTPAEWLGIPLDGSVLSTADFQAKVLQSLAAIGKAVGAAAPTAS